MQIVRHRRTRTSFLWPGDIVQLMLYLLCSAKFAVLCSFMVPDNSPRQLGVVHGPSLLSNPCYESDSNRAEKPLAQFRSFYSGQFSSMLWSGRCLHNAVPGGDTNTKLSVFSRLVSACFCMSQLRVLSSRSAGLKILHRPIRANRTTSGGAASMSVSRYQLQKDTQLVIQKGDITEWEGDAVVNAGPQSHFCPC